MRKLYLTILCFLPVVVPNSYASPIYMGEIQIEEVNDEPYWKAKDTSSEPVLDGQEVIVRVYRNWKGSPEIFEKVPVKIKDRRCTIEGTSAVFVVIGDDQMYETVKKVIGDHIYAAYEKLDFELISYADIPLKDSRWFFDDVLGNNITNAGVEMFLFDYWSGKRVKIGNFQTDGTLKKFVPQGIESFELAVSNPKYGIAKVRFYQGSDRSHFTIPLVDVNSLAATSAIWGYIVDSDNNPVEGAEIQCDYVRTLGEGLIEAKPDTARYTAVSDRRGFFNMYLPPGEQRQDERGALIPLKSKYHVKINAPKQLGFLPYEGPLENGKELKVILERPTGKNHVLVFRDEHGVITDPNKLKQIVIHIQRPDKMKINLTYDKFKDLDVFPYGAYIAEAEPYPMPGEPYKFKPLEVTENSPRELVFTLPEALTYYGQIVHGITGATLPGAFIRLMHGGCDGHFSSITDEQWKALRALGSDPNIHEKALSPLNDIYIFSRLVRTDSSGRFQINTGRQQSFWGFEFFEEDYIPAELPKFGLKSAVNNRVEIEPIRLFPAAKVTVEPRVDGNNVGIYPDWLIDERNNPDWTGALLKNPLRRGTWLKPNQVNTLYVPAGLQLKLKLSMPYHEQWCPVIFDQVIFLQQGQTLDLGKYTLKPAIEISARVLNAASEPVEGIPVRAIFDGHGTVAHNSDANGIVRFQVPPNTKGEFVVHYIDEAAARELLRETTPFEAANESRQFTIKISDEMLALFSK